MYRDVLVCNLVWIALVSIYQEIITNKRRYTYLQIWMHYLEAVATSAQKLFFIYIPMAMYDNSILERDSIELSSFFTQAIRGQTYAIKITVYVCNI